MHSKSRFAKQLLALIVGVSAGFLALAFLFQHRVDWTGLGALWIALGGMWLFGVALGRWVMPQDAADRDAPAWESLTPADQAVIRAQHRE